MLLSQWTCFHRECGRKSSDKKLTVTKTMLQHFLQIKLCDYFNHKSEQEITFLTKDDLGLP